MATGAGRKRGGGSGRAGDFTGVWAMDRARSDNPAVHLEGMGLPDMAQQAAARIEPTYTLQWSEREGVLKVRHTSELGTKVRTLKVGEEHKEMAADGAAIRMVLEYVPTSHALVITTEWAGRGRVVDTRTLQEGGTVLHQSIQFNHKSTKAKTTVTNRYFIRTTADPYSVTGGAGEE